jgi:hypothetical protein
VLDEIEGARIRTARKQQNLAKKARVQANKMATYDSAMETTYANSKADLDIEIRSYGKSSGHVLKYLQEQFKGRKLLKQGHYNTIPTLSKFRSAKKPYKLRMFPPTNPHERLTTQAHTAYLRELLGIMIDEDNARAEE